MDLEIVIVSYNTKSLLAQCLESVYAGLERAGLQGRIWVVDNASSDGSASMVRDHHPAVQLLALDRNLGFAAGNNAALQACASRGRSEARHILFLNPDTLVQGDALGGLVRWLDATPDAGAAGARLVYRDGGFQHSAFRFAGLAQVFFDFFPVHHRLLESRLNGRYSRRAYEAGLPFEVDHPLGAALMVRSAVLRQVGSFDERFFMYCEEVDLCRRIWAAGWRVFCVPGALIVHLEGQSAKQFRDRMFVELWRSRFLMYEKYESRAFRWAARALVRLGLAAGGWRARKAFRRGAIGEAQLSGHLAAYREVASL
ncbi:MAG TPA: glycosyltransferase family 2 protein [Anaerolineae bacterium]|nr:glycosyltransferase family 2 protein [Anaerolineae bacterium]